MSFIKIIKSDFLDTLRLSNIYKYVQWPLHIGCIEQLLDYSYRVEVEDV